MSLKDAIDVSPKNTTEYLDAVEDVQKGKKGATERLYKFVESGWISFQDYEELIEKYENVNSVNKKFSPKIKSVLSVVVIFTSMLCGLAYLIEKYGKGVAVCYFFLWILAISYAFSNRKE